MKNLNSRVKAPEFAMMWSLLLSPLIGSIFWTKNWIALGRQKHIWWTWVSAVIVIIIAAFSKDLFGNEVIKYCSNFAWIAFVYLLQRRLIPREKKSIPALIISAILVVIIIAIGSGYLNTWLARSGSMSPAIQNNDRLIAQKINNGKGINRGDVVVITPPAGANIEGQIISRVIGLPGERLSVHDGKVFINGKALKESYISEKPSYTYLEVIIPPDSYFVMGDNRDRSNDSHIWGFLPKDNISSRILLRYWPLNSIGRLEGPGPSDD